MSVPGTLLWLDYRLNRHKVGPLPLSGLALCMGGTAWIGAWKGWLSPPQAAAISLICWSLTGIGLWACWQGYLRFLPEDAPTPADVLAPLPDQHIPIYASGRFEVMYKRRDFIGAQAAGRLQHPRLRRARHHGPQPQVPLPVAGPVVPGRGWVVVHLSIAPDPGGHHAGAAHLQPPPPAGTEGPLSEQRKQHGVHGLPRSRTARPRVGRLAQRGRSRYTERIAPGGKNLKR